MIPRAGRKSIDRVHLISLHQRSEKNQFPSRATNREAEKTHQTVSLHNREMPRQNRRCTTRPRINPFDHNQPPTKPTARSIFSARAIAHLQDNPPASSRASQNPIYYLLSSREDHRTTGGNEKRKKKKATTSSRASARKKKKKETEAARHSHARAHPACTYGRRGQVGRGVGGGRARERDTPTDRHRISLSPRALLAPPAGGGKGIEASSLSLSRSLISSPALQYRERRPSVRAAGLHSRRRASVRELAAAAAQWWERASREHGSEQSRSRAASRASLLLGPSVRRDT